MNRSAPVRILFGALFAMFIALASLAVVPSPANGDSNEGTANIDPDYRTNAGKIAAGDGHTCAVAGPDAHVYCWGWNGAGQLGNGTTIDSAEPVQVKLAGEPIEGVVDLTAGGNYTCAIFESGLGRCWGGGGAGQLGTGSTGSVSHPVAIAGNHFFTGISASYTTTCGTTATQLYCWGNNESGQLGQGDLIERDEPTLVNISGTPASVSVGAGTVCATNTAKDLFCWGSNSHGQVGIGTTGSDRTTPLQVSSLTDVEAVTNGAAHTCAISSAAVGAGTYCWGAGSDGRLGRNSTTPSNIPVLISGLGVADRVISADGNHTCVTDAAYLRCWGDNQYGQLGNGTTTDSLVPFQVPGYTAEVPTITTGYDHTCVQFQSGAVDCWGQNDRGQLGNGTTTNSSTGVHALQGPDVLTNVVITPDDHALNVAWDFPDEDGVPITGYHLKDLNGAFDFVTPNGAGNNRTIENLVEGQSYRISVSAINDVGEGPAVVMPPVVMDSGPYVEINDYAAYEGDSGRQTLIFSVHRFGTRNAAVQVRVSTSDGTAIQPGDYVKRSTVVKFKPFETVKEFQVKVKGDKLVEDDESLNVTLSEPVGAQIWDGSGTGTIWNDDAGVKPAFVVDNVNMVEGDSGSTNMIFTITRTGSSAAKGSVRWQPLGLAMNATAGEDFAAKNPTKVSFAAGVTSKTVKVKIFGDTDVEANEYFQVVLSDAVNGDLPFPNWGYGQILNDD
ncbi:Calx-beta domain-containing protein [Nocardioides humilatus]|uniref:Calx-beta domain-containing protein n=1 Tax=Nocardioides humilatus TaxID=2607660 RepID=UPI00165FCA97|nr:Calx-beta domain-containing protein [Nocardioides humilatus]